MAISTYKTYLVKKDTGGEGTTYTKLVDIKSFPDLGGTPEMLETTTMSDPMQTNILGIQSSDALEFTANYTKEDFAKIKALEGKENDYAVVFGDNGENGVYGWTGGISVFITGGEVNAVVDMTISCVASTPIEEIADATINLE